MMTTKGKLKSKKFREAYAAERVRSGVAYQITALREQRKLSQAELGQMVGKPQSVISRLENPDYGRVSLKTLIEVADALDIALIVKFTEFSKVVADAENLSPSDLMVESFDNDFGFAVKSAPNVSTSSAFKLVKCTAKKFGFDRKHANSTENYIEIFPREAHSSMKKTQDKMSKLLSVGTENSYFSNNASIMPDQHEAY